MPAVPLLIFLLFLFAAVLLWLASRQRRSAGLPGGTIIYADTGKWQPVDQPLYDPIWDLAGKPDYLVRTGKEIIPVEVKSGRTPSAPYDSHIYQLAAYCLLVERVLNVRPSCGYINYPTRTFQVDYTRELEQSLKDLLEDIRSSQRKKDIPRSHEDPVRCKGCGFQDVCEERL